MSRPFELLFTPDLARRVVNDLLEEKPVVVPKTTEGFLAIAGAALFLLDAAGRGDPNIVGSTTMHPELREAKEEDFARSLVATVCCASTLTYASCHPQRSKSLDPLVRVLVQPTEEYPFWQADEGEDADE